MSARVMPVVVPEWAYDANADGTGLGWDRSFLSEVGFGEAELLPSVIGSDVQAPGVQIEGGLGESAASSFGLPVGTPIAVGMIDAHAGGIGCLGATLPAPSSEQYILCTHRSDRRYIHLSHGLLLRADLCPRCMGPVLLRNAAQSIPE